MTPYGFLEGLKGLGIDNLSETDVQCLMLILVKPELDNAIVVNDLVMVMENFQIQENGSSNHQQSHPNDDDEPVQPSADPESKPKEKKKNKMNFDKLSDAALSVIYEISQYAQDNDLMSIFKEHSYEQVVKTKKKENTIEIIKADDFFKDLSNNGICLLYTSPSPRDQA